MDMPAWLRHVHHRLFGFPPRRRPTRSGPRWGRRATPRLEALEERVTPTTYNVTPTGTGVNSLAGAVDQANIDTSADTIVLAPGQYNLSAQLTILDFNGLTIQGSTSSPSDTVINAAANNRVFLIHGGGTNVGFQNLTIQGGFVTSGDNTPTAQGGGILDNGGAIALTNVVVQNNVVEASTAAVGQGGGIFVSGGSLAIHNSVIDQNQVFGGQGVAAVSAVKPKGGNGGNAFGGGIYVSGVNTSVILDSVKLESNDVSGGLGAAGFNSFAGGTRGDGGNGGAATGGGLYVTGSGTVQITNATLTDNRAVGGLGGQGGKGINNPTPGGSGGNGGAGGTGNGGGLYVAPTAGVVLTVGLSADILTFNVSEGGQGGQGGVGGTGTPAGGAAGAGGNGGTSFGGGADAEAGANTLLTFSVTGSLFQNNETLGGIGGAGGAGGAGLQPASSNALGDGGVGGAGGIGGQAFGAGAYLNASLSSSNPQLSITQSTLATNAATGGAGGTGGDGGDTYETNGAFGGSSTTVGGTGGAGGLGGGGFGGGVSAATATITASTLSADTATGGDGGGGGKGGISVTGGKGGKGGTGGDGGGGGANLGSVGTLVNSTLAGDSATGGNGGNGGIGGKGVGTGTSLTGPGGDGGDGGAGGNGFGSGIYFGSGGSWALVNVTVADNKTVASLGGSAGAGGTGIGGSGLSGATGLAGTTIGGGIYNPASVGMSVALTNTLVALNSAASAPDFSGAVASSDHNLIGDGDGSTGFSAAAGDQVGTAFNPLNPSLGSLTNNGGPTQTLALNPGSSAIDAGDNSATNVTGSFDQRGVNFPRVVGGAIDIGAYEYQPPSPPGEPASPPSPPSGPTPSFFQAALSLFIDGYYLELNQILGQSTAAVQANIDANLPYAGIFGPFFVLAGEQALFGGNQSS